MDIEAIGIATIACGLIGWFAGPRFAIPVFVASTLLSAAAALLLPHLGYANVQPAHLLLGFLALSLVASRPALRRAADAVAFPKAGFWLLLTAIYAVVAAYFLPRIFAGATYVFAVARTQVGLGIISEPLAPTSANITQTVYFIGDIVCFLIFYVHASKPRGLVTCADAVLVCAAVNLVFVALDLGTYWTGTSDALGFIRNANYRMLDDATVLGFKRIVGSFPEASTFAYFTSGLFAFCTGLWLSGIRQRASGPLALLSLAALVACTSSTGYAALCGFLALLFTVSVIQALRRPVTRASLALVAIVPIAVVAGIGGLRLSPPAWQFANDMVQTTVFNKMNSSSGIERSKWNDQALANLADTRGLGGGTGSVRASSFPIAVLGNIGVVGALLYGLFLIQLFFGRRQRWGERFPAGCQGAARWACLAQLVGASVAGSFIDLGLPFFLFAGIACAGPERTFAPRAIPEAPPVAATAAAE